MTSPCKNHETGEEGMLDMMVPPGGRTISDSLIQIMSRGWWIILLATVVALTAAFVYLAKTTPVYTSTSRIYVEQTGPRIFTETEEGVMTRSNNYLYTQAGLLKSTPIVAGAIEALDVRQMRTFAQVEDPVGYLKRSLVTNVGKRDDLISVSSDSPYPAEAAQLVNAVVDSYIEYHEDRKKTTATEVLRILREEKEDRDKELADKLKAMVEFKKKNPELGLESNEGNIILQRVVRLTEAVTQAQLSTIDAKSTYDMIKAIVDDPGKVKQIAAVELAKGAFISTSSENDRLHAELDRLDLQLADLVRQLTLTRDHPVVKELESRITQTKKKIADLEHEFVQSRLAVAERQYLGAKQKEDELRRHLEEQREKAFTLDEQLGQYTILQSDWEQTKRLCDILNDRIKELSVTEDAGALNITVLEVARPAGSPSEPQKTRIMGIALVLGLMMGGGLALLRDWMDQRLRSADEILAALGVPVLGIVPSMSKKQSVVERGQRVRLDSDSQAAEAYRTIRTAVFFRARKGEAKTILVTSPAAVDGKTTLVSNLAITMAQAGQKTLILDADFRKPMQHNIFEVNHQDKGLSSVLERPTMLEETIEPTGVENLELLASGPHVPNPSELLSSENFAKLLELLSKKYDRVIIDSPAVMPATDAQILAAICDITLVVLRSERSTRRISRQARDGLVSVGAHVLGVVVNDVPRKSRYGYCSG